ncbi:phage terminase large subunit [uncultured Mediterranean phage uvMED]|nr:phage terminase large subunit [uncultured Mediterranean phage uvMED]
MSICQRVKGNILHGEGLYEVPSAIDTQKKITKDLLPHQLKFCEDIEHRKLALVCGFGAGKTYALVSKSIIMASMNVGCISAIFEPTAPMLRDILMRTMNELLELWEIPFTFRASPLPEYQLQFKEGVHTILLRTILTYQRLRGQNLCAVGFDEADTVNKRDAEQAMNMALARLRSGNVQQFYATTTPEGHSWAFDTFEKNAKEDTRLIKAKTADNPYLPEGFIDSLLENYPPQLIQAYLNGNFCNLTTGQVYDKFDRNIHVLKSEPFVDENEPIRVGIDFNIGNMNAVIGIAVGNKFMVIDEIAKSHDTDSIAKEIKGRYPFNKIYIYPDASGGNRSTNATRTDIQILESYGFINQSALSNPAVRDRVNSVQGMFLNGKGESKMMISKKAIKLIECLELQSYNEKGEPDKDAGYDHMNDALGYITWRLFNPLHMSAGRKTGIRLY